MAITKSSVFGSVSLLNTHVDVPNDQQIQLSNRVNPGRAIVGDFLINPLFNNDFILFEIGTHTENFILESGTLTTLQTGLSSNWTYSMTQTGYVKISVDGVVKNFEVKEYFNTSYDQGVVRMMKILQEVVDRTASLQWINNTSVSSFENHPRILINGTTYDFAVPNTFTVSLPSSGDVAFQFRHMVNQNDLNTSPGLIALSAEIYDGPLELVSQTNTNANTDNPVELILSPPLIDLSSLNSNQLTVRMYSENSVIQW